MPSGAPDGEPGLDVTALVRELRTQAEELRDRLGASALPAAESRSEVLAAAALEREHTDSEPWGGSTSRAVVKVEHLSALADPGDAEIHSHRVGLGRAVITAKRLLRRLLTPVLDRQAAYNRAVIQSLADLESDVAGRITSLRRHLLALEAALEASPSLGAGMAEAFDYAAFEEAFRGPRDRVREAQRRYLAYFSSPESGPVVDLGCGRGEFLELLRAAGVGAWGVESNPALVELARAARLDVHHDDLTHALEGVADASLGGVVCFQVVEHLSLPRLVELLALARRKLRPAGCLIAETVNVQSLFTLAHAWTIDPTHRQPLHPLTLRFLADQAGFARSELVFSGEVDESARLEDPGGDDPASRNVRRLNELLYGAQDYAVVAWA